MKKIAKFLRQPFVLLLTVPAIIAISIGVLPFLTVFLERTFATGKLSPYFTQFDVESARTLLSVIAASAFSALTLTYSLVLLVFTLAAGNVGPRLLKRFSSDLVNQVTAGVFGGTFIFAITTLLFTKNDFIPKFTIAGAGALAIFSVLQLIFFVRHVAASVSIDDEVAEIADRLNMIIDRQNNRDQYKEDINDKDFSVELKSPSSGYIANIDTSQIVETAQDADVHCLINFSTGHFVLEEETLICIDGDIDDDMRELILGAIEIEPARGDNDSIEFSINLLIEIAIRALSPGVNDTYTALAATDHISNVIGQISPEMSNFTCVKDQRGEVRLITPGISMEYLMDLAFHPLRQSSGDNLLMAAGIARSLKRLYVGSHKSTRACIAEHVSLLTRQLESSDHLEEDTNRVLSLLPDTSQ